MTDLLVEVLDQNWVTKGVTGAIRSCSITDELGAVGEASVEIERDDPIADTLPNPDAANPYEGRFKIYEDGVLKFAGVIDATTRKLSADGQGIEFGGKHRGIITGFYNTGRRDFIGWSLPELYSELLQDNIAKTAVIYSTTDEDELYRASKLTTGDPNSKNYWLTLNGLPATTIIDLGSNQQIDAIRVMPQWWKDPTTKRFDWHDYTVDVSTSPTSGWVNIITKTNNYPSSAIGLRQTCNVVARYVRLTVTASSHGQARIAQLMVFQNIATVGGDTTYITPFVENDDSGNCVTSGTVTQPVTPGAFQGDQVITYSSTTRLGTGGSITQTFRGVSSAVFFTQHTDGAATADIYLDGAFRQTVSIPNNSYWYKGYDSYEDVGLLANGQHTLQVVRNTGTPQVDYFNGLYETSWRPIEDDDSSLAYLGAWAPVEASYFHNYFAVKSTAYGNELHYVFTGDKIRLKGEKLPGGGGMTIYIDGVSQGSFSTDAATAHRQVLFSWSGSYGTHRMRVATQSSAPVIIDRIEGNFRHTLYLRARYEPNLKVLTRLSEIMDSYLRFNNDGSVDLLGAVGSYGGTIIREGENEGGSIINASRKHDYSQTGSVCLALVNVNGEAPIKSLVIDYEAMKEIGYKVVRLENSDAADQFLLNRQALQYLRDHRKPDRAYDVEYDTAESGEVTVGDTTKLYSPSVGLSGDEYRIGKITTTYKVD